MEAKENLVPPFSYFGGKRRVADEVWRRFGDVQGYAEPFFGAGAVLLGRPNPKGVEVVNDINHLLVNAWRGIKLYPEKMAEYCNYPNSEIELIQRRRWLGANEVRVREVVESGIDACDIEAAGYWLWRAQREIGNNIDCHGRNSRPKLNPTKINRENVLLIGSRICNVSILCGGWLRCVDIFLSKDARYKRCGIFLDPPYGDSRCVSLYGRSDSVSVHKDVGKWCLENGDNPRYRIALCGYEGEHDLPGWSVFGWKSSNPMVQSHNGVSNRERERIWFSPHCERGSAWTGGEWAGVD